jgi:hypothetical protein
MAIFKFYEVTYKFTVEEVSDFTDKKGVEHTKVKLRKKTERCLISAPDIKEAEKTANIEIPKVMTEEFDIIRISESKILWVKNNL